MSTLGELGEFEVIRRLTAARGGAARAGSSAAGPRAGVVLGSGDDAAVLRPAPGADLVATTDAFVEGGHFLRGWCPPRTAGARLAQANLSDLAAMAATPRWALLSVGARPESEVADLVAFQSGLSQALEAAGAVLVGGNLTAVAGAEWYSLTLLGECERGGQWTRSGARPGDLIAVSGRPGRAGAGLALVRALGDGARAPGWAPLLEAWLAPVARVTLARALRETGTVRAAIDVSDGFAGDLGHLCESGGVGAEVDEAEWPDDALLAGATAALGVATSALRFGPSDDYELLLAVDPAGRAGCERAAAGAGVPLAFVGRFTAAPGPPTLRSADRTTRPLGAAGFDHFGDTG
jgi:thiamine-monophosphate kinase